jgi:predicted phosphatase
MGKSDYFIGHNMKSWMLLKHLWIVNHSVMEDADGGVVWFHAEKNILEKWIERSGEVIVFGSRSQKGYQTEKEVGKKNYF